MEIKGVTANPGVVRGKVLLLTEPVDLRSVSLMMGMGDIIVAQNASPKLIVLYKRAGALVVEQGGLLSHATKLSRELNIPCVVGIGEATKFFKDGDMVEVDADRGVVRKI